MATRTYVVFERDTRSGIDGDAMSSGDYVEQNKRAELTCRALTNRPDF